MLLGHSGFNWCFISFAPGFEGGGVSQPRGLRV